MRDFDTFMDRVARAVGIPKKYLLAREKSDFRQKNRKPGSVASGTNYSEGRNPGKTTKFIEYIMGIDPAYKAGKESRVILLKTEEGYKVVDCSARPARGPRMAERREEELAPIRASVYKIVRDDMDRIRMIALAKLEWNQEQNYGPDVIQMQRRDT